MAPETWGQFNKTSTLVIYKCSYCFIKLTLACFAGVAHINILKFTPKRYMYQLFPKSCSCQNISEYISDSGHFFLFKHP